MVPAGKLLVTLDDVEARAQVASAESGVKTAQAALDAADAQRNPGGAAGRRRGDRAGSAGAGPGATRSGCADQAGCDRRRRARRSDGRARERLETAQASLKAAEQSAQHRYSPARDCPRPGGTGTMPKQHWRRRSTSNRKPRIYAPIAGTIYTMDAAPSEYRRSRQIAAADGRPAP